MNDQRPHGLLPRRIGTAVLIAALAAAPFVLSSYAIGFTSRILVFGLLALSVNLLTGLTGLTVIGQAAYFGVGAYTGALIALKLTPVGLVQLVCAVLASALVAGLIGLVVARTRGTTFVMISVAVGQLIFTAATQWKSITQGSDGLVGVPATVPVWGLPALQLDGLTYYYVLVFFLLLFALMAMLARSPFGLALRALRDNEARLRASGYPVNRYVWTAYVLAGALAGAAGSLYVASQRFISPPDMGFQASALVLLAVLIGGAGSLWGSCLGAAVVLLTRDYLGGIQAARSVLFLGLLYVLVVYLLPNGIAGLAGDLARRWWRRRSGTATAGPADPVPADTVPAGSAAREGEPV